MHFFDVTAISVDEQLLRLLGYAKTLILGKDLFLDNKNQEVKTLISMQNEKNQAKAIRQQNVIGIKFDGGKAPDKKTLEQMAEMGKVLAINLSSLTNQADVSRAIGSTSNLVKKARHADVKIALASFAESKEDLLSTKQAISIGVLLGMPIEEAKNALSFWGEL